MMYIEQHSVRSIRFILYLPVNVNHSCDPGLNLGSSWSSKSHKSWSFDRSCMTLAVAMEMNQLSTTPPMYLLCCFLQMFTYPSLSPVSALSGVISPTTFSLFTSPGATPRTTPRSTPVPRWTTPFIPLDDNVDYTMMVNMVSGNSSDETILQDGGCRKSKPNTVLLQIWKRLS